MITVNCLMDEAAYPWQADWYRARAEAALGDEFGERYRIWFVDHAMHVPPSRYLSPNEGADPIEHHGPTDTHVVSYRGILEQALRDVAAWAEEGVAPPASTEYRVDDGQVIVPPTAAERCAVQPVVDLLANGGARAEVAVGEAVDLRATIDVPSGAGVVVSVEWDYDGSGTYADGEEPADPAASAHSTRQHAYAEPGTYFVTVRVASQRPGDIGSPIGRALNLGRARVVVS
jgi:hypothetical protein